MNSPLLSEPALRLIKSVLDKFHVMMSIGIVLKTLSPVVNERNLKSPKFPSLICSKSVSFE